MQTTWLCPLPIDKKTLFGREDVYNCPNQMLLTHFYSTLHLLL